MFTNLVFNYYDGILKPIVLYVGFFIVFCSFLYSVISCGFGVIESIISFFTILIVGFIFGEIGYRIFYYKDIEHFHSLSSVVFKIFNLGFFRDNTIGFVDNKEISNFGIIIGVMIGALIPSFVFNKNVYKLLDCCSIPICIFLITSRILNLFNIENYGLVTEKAFGIIFPDVDSLPRHACMIYEIVCAIFIIIILLITSNQCNMYAEKRLISYKNGFLFFLTIFLIYFVCFFIEFIKVQENLMSNVILDFLHINMNQFLSLCLAVPSLIFVIFLYPSKKK